MLHSAELPEPGLATRVSCLTLMELNIGRATAETAGYWLLSIMSSHLQLTKRSRNVAHISMAPVRFWHTTGCKAIGRLAQSGCDSIDMPS